LTDPKTKKVFVHMGALMRVEWSGLVEVPADMENYEILNRIYDAVDGGEYCDDNEYWERGDGHIETSEAIDKDEPKYRLTAGESYEFEYIGPPITPAEHPLKAQLSLCERGGNMFVDEDRNFNAWLPLDGGYLEITFRAENYPSLNTAFVQMSEAELATHIRENLVGFFVRKCDIDGVYLDHQGCVASTDKSGE